MATKKRSATADKDLKRTVKKLRSQLDRSDAKADKWKKKATKSQAEVKKLTKRLDKASRPAKQSSADDSSSPAVAPIPAVAAEPEDVTAIEPAETTNGSESAGPNADWTVVQLRAEARSRGLTGLSGKSKAQLLEALA